MPGIISLLSHTGVYQLVLNTFHFITFSGFWWNKTSISLYIQMLPNPINSEQFLIKNSISSIFNTSALHYAKNYPTLKCWLAPVQSSKWRKCNNHPSLSSQKHNQPFLSIKPLSVMQLKPLHHTWPSNFNLKLIDDNSFTISHLKNRCVQLWCRN